MCFNGKGVVAFHETSQMLWKDPIKKNCFWRGGDHKNQHRLSTKNTVFKFPIHFKGTETEICRCPIRDIADTNKDSRIPLCGSLISKRPWLHSKIVVSKCTFLDFKQQSNVLCMYMTYDLPT